MSYFSRELLWYLRNEVKWKPLLENESWPHKMRAGQRVFLCPRCHELVAVVNPRTNLGRCFRCKKNFNPIDFIIVTQAFGFVAAVEYLLDLFPPPPNVTMSGSGRR